MKKLRFFRNKKGFTLIECVVAIAIFAIMSSMVMQMLAISIVKHKNNNHVEKDMDSQIQNIITDNSLVERGTTDLAVQFLLNGGNVAAEIEIEDITIMKNPDGELANDRLELNTFGATNMAPDPDDNDNDNGGSMITEDVHIYGAKGVSGGIYVSNLTVTDTDDGRKKVIINFQINDTDEVLSKAESNAIKIVLPESAEVTNISCDTMTTYLRLSSSRFRIFDKSVSTKESTRTATFTFLIDADKYDEEYGSFAKFFIDPESTSTDKSATFKDTTTPGIYKDKA